MTTSFRQFFARRPRPLAKKAISPVRLRAERLEARDVPATFTVVNTNATGTGSLAQAILDANAAPGADTINFDPTTFASKSTISVTNGFAPVTEGVTVVGPGSGKLTINRTSGAGQFRVLEFNDANPTVTSNMTLSGLTIDGFSLPAVTTPLVPVTSGIIFNNGENLSLTDVVLNSNTTGFGTLTMANPSIGFYGTLTMTNCSVTNNSNTTTSSLSLNGVVRAPGESTVTVTNCLFDTNVTDSTNAFGGTLTIRNGFAGGAGGKLTVTNSTFNNNSGGRGAGILVYGEAGVGTTSTSISGSTFTLNKSNSTVTYGGALLVRNTVATVTGNLFTGNQARQGPAVAFVSANATLNSNTIAANTGTFGGALVVRSTSTVTINNSLIGAAEVVSKDGNGNPVTTTFVGNTASSRGGAVFVSSGTSVTLDNTTLTANTAVGVGGAINIQGGATVSVVNSTLTGNTTFQGGGIYVYPAAGNLTVRGSTLSGNKAAGAAQGAYTADGGGLYFGGTVVGTVIIENSTLANNTAAGNGGAIAAPFLTSGKIQVRNTTIAGNTADVAGGGISAAGAGTITLDSVIVGDNSVGVTGDDVSVTATLTANNSLIENKGTTTVGGANNLFVDPLLDKLSNYGGLTETFRLQDKSPAIDKGSNVGSLTTDQRGGIYGRTYSATGTASTDIGAYEVQPAGIPGASGKFPDVTTAGATSQSITVTYVDDTAISYDSVTKAANAPATIFLTASLVSADGLTTTKVTLPATLVPGTATPATTPGSPTITATYTFTPPGGTWDAADIGTYTVNVAGSKVSDLTGNFVPGGGIGTFQVALPATFIVTTTADGGAGSLRDAVARANANPFTADTITFSTTTFNAAQTITLTTGELLVTDSVQIQGTDSTKLTIDGNAAGRVFRIDGSGVLTVGLSSMTLTNGKTGTGFLAAGGAIRVANEAVTLTKVHLGSSSTGNEGGGIYVSQFGNLTLNQSLLDANTAALNGGGILTDLNTTLTVLTSTISKNVTEGIGNGGGIGVADSQNQPPTITITNSAIGDNTAAGNGGGLAFGSPNVAAAVNGNGSFNIQGSTFSGNSAINGGGIYFFGRVYTTNGQGGLIRNSTIAGNTVVGSGGGIGLFNLLGTLQLVNSTVTGNSAGVAGGGVYDNNAGNYVRAINVTSSIVSGNTAAASNDIQTAVAVGLNFSAVGDSAGFTFTGANNLAFGADLKLAALAKNGGPTQTVALQLGSAAINKGSNPATANPATAVQAFDQRGVGFPRVRGGAPDIGAFELLIPGQAPTAAATSQTVTTTAAAAVTITVVYSSDESTIDTATLDNNDLQIVGPDGTKFTATKLTVTPGGAAGAQTVTYSFTPPGGAFDVAEIGAYTINVVAGQVADKGTPAQAVAAGAVGTVFVALPTTFVVTTTADSGPGSLRQAVLDANTNAPALDSITFASTVFNTAQTITLTTGQLLVTDGVSIDGLNKVTIDGNAASRVLGISGPGQLTVTLNGLTIQNGSSTGTAGGGGIAITDESVTITNSAIVNNSGLYGGGIGGSANGAVLTVSNSLIANNTASDTGTLGDGGGISVFGASKLSLTNVTVVGNKTTSGTDGTGGGISLSSPAAGASVTIVNSTIANNQAAGPAGGGISTEGFALTLTNSIVAGNTSQIGVDDISAGNVTANASVIGAADSGFVFAGGTGNATGTAANQLDAKLGPLASNGGPTQTVALLAGSPAIDLGAATATVATDQRGIGFARVSNGKVDAGAFEVQVGGTDTVAPTASGTLANVTTRKGATYTFTVTLADNVGVFANSVQGSDFTVTGPNGYSQTATLVSLLPAGNPGSATATLSVTAPGGAFDVADNGTYSVTLTGSITDTSGNAVKTGSLGTFAVQAPVAVQSVVTKLSDGTTTSLTTTGQRSVIPNIVITYDGIATGANLAASYKLLNTSTNATVAVNVSTTTVAGHTVATVTPVAPLANAYYTFTAFGTAIATANVAPVVVGLDGDDNGTAGGNFVLDFHRFAGDVTGDTAVDGDDLAALAAAFNSVDGDANYRAYLDLDGDGAVDGNDLAVFAQSFLLGIL